MVSQKATKKKLDTAPIGCRILDDVLLAGGGNVEMSNHPGNMILGTGDDAHLVLEANNTILGSGSIGSEMTGKLRITNRGTIKATQSALPGLQTFDQLLDGGLLRGDKTFLYPIHDGIPVLLADEAIPLAQLASS